MIWRRHRTKIYVFSFALVLYLIYAYFLKNGNSEIEEMKTATTIEPPRGSLRETVTGNTETSVLAWQINKWEHKLHFCSKEYKLDQTIFHSPAGDIFMYMTDSKDISPPSDPDFKMFADHIASDPELGFIDLGGHAGEYALTAARYGREVTVVTPLWLDIIQFCKSVHKNNLLDRVVLFYCGDNDSKEVVTNLLKDKEQQSPEIETKLNAKGSYSLFQSERLYLDDLLPYVKSKKVIMKVYLDGHEYDVLHRSARLFKEVDVKIVMMTWDKVRTTPQAVTLIELFLGYIYKPYTIYSNDKDAVARQTELVLHDYKTWPAHVQWIKNI